MTTFHDPAAGLRTEPTDAQVLAMLDRAQLLARRAMDAVMRGVVAADRID